VMSRLPPASWAGQRFGGLVYGSETRLDVALHAAQRLVPGLGHDHVRGGVRVPEMGD